MLFTTVNFKDFDGHDALAHAVGMGHVDTTQALIQHWLNEGHHEDDDGRVGRDNNGRTHLIIAAKRGRTTPPRPL